MSWMLFQWSRRASTRKNELFSAVAERRVVPTQHRAHRFGEAHEYAVSLGVPIRVVDALEVIEIDHHQEE